MVNRANTYSFVAILRPIVLDPSQLEDSLFAAGCDDATIGIRNGVVYLDFDREAPCFEEAILSAIKDIERADIGARVAWVEPGDFVTAAEIARRVGKSRESVRLWIEGERGPGGFPSPCAGVSGGVILWSWAEVARWLSENNRLEDEQVLQEAEIIVDLNAALEQRSCMRRHNRRRFFLDCLGREKSASCADERERRRITA